MSDRMSVTIPDGLADLVEAINRESAATDDVPYLPKAEALRILASDGARNLVDEDLSVRSPRLSDAIDGEALLDLIPDHERARYLREQVKRENWLADMRGGFEGRVRNELEKRFKNGYDPDDAADVAEGLIKEARIYYVIIEDDEESFREAQEYVHDRIEDYRERYQETTWDFEDDWLGGYSGVQAGREQEVVAESAVEIATDVAERIEGGARDPDAVVDAVAKKYGVDEEQVWELVRAIKDTDGPALIDDETIPELGGVPSDD